MADTPKCEECGEPMQLVMDPEDYPKKLYAVLSSEANCDPSVPLDPMNDLALFTGLNVAALSNGYAENMVGEYILNKVFRVKAKFEVVEDEAGIES
jgi:hypothetical protein